MKENKLLESILGKDLVELPVLNIELLGNTLLAWLVFLAAGLFFFLVGKMTLSFIIAKLRKVSERYNSTALDVVRDVIDETSTLFLFVVSFVTASSVLTLSVATRGNVKTLFILAFLVQAGVWLSDAANIFIKKYFRARYGDNPTFLSTLGLIKFALRTIIWSIVTLLILDNFGIDITALVAGLGVGGIAVALAVQNILGDLLGSLSIVLDKPFVVDDFIIVDGFMGSVEHIGIKTTRVRSLSGEQLIFPNSDLLSSRIRNFKRMNERRVAFNLGVIYQTSSDQLKKIPDMIRNAIEANDQTRFDRSHFKGFGASSLDFETVYYVLTPDYAIYMDIQQAINLELFENFKEAGIEFAYPTQTLFIESEESSEEDAKVNCA